MDKHYIMVDIFWGFSGFNFFERAIYTFVDFPIKKSIDSHHIFYSVISTKRRELDVRKAHMTLSGVLTPDNDVRKAHMTLIPVFNGVCEGNFVVMEYFLERIFNIEADFLIARFCARDIRDMYAIT